MQTSIKEIYNKTGYLDHYGGSLVLTLLIIFIAFLSLAYYYVKLHIKPLKANWSENKCHPLVMPFAGIINKPDDKTASEFAKENFSECLTQILSKVVAVMTMPIKFSLSLIRKFFKILQDAIQQMRELMNYVRKSLMEMVREVMNRILNVVISLRSLLINFKSVFDKIKAALVSVLYTIVSIYFALKSFMGAFLELVIKMLVILAAIIIVMWIFPWTYGIAGALTAFFVSISVPLVLIAIVLGQVLRLTSGNIPSTPTCFDENTIIETVNGKKKIKDIKVGESLKNGSCVTSTFKLANTKTIIYKIGDVLVTGDHLVNYKGLGWIASKEHPESIEMSYNKPYLYCLNTSNKIIEIDGKTFLDWDELDSLDIEKLKCASASYVPTDFKAESIHKYIDGGFVSSTKIELEDGRLVNIKDVEINEQLRFGERVLGVVEIDATNMNGVGVYKFGDKTFIGGPNLRIRDNILGNITSLDFYGEQVQDVKKLYHLITDRGFFNLEGIRFFDYNGLLEPIIWNSKNYHHSY
tara:strand:- start:886 stop:2457 length:1572 start_codon:yes stop_codon:yes gene_type:complete